MEEQTKGGRHPGRAEVGWLVVITQWAPATRPVRRRTGPTTWSSGPGLGAEDAIIGGGFAMMGSTTMICFAFPV